MPQAHDATQKEEIRLLYAASLLFIYYYEDYYILSDYLSHKLKR